MTSELSQADARIIAVAAQLGTAYDHPLDVVRATGLIQLDGMSVVAPSHRLAVLARTRDVNHHHIDNQIWDTDTPQVFETYTRVACLLPISSWPYLHEARSRAHARMEASGTADPAIVTDILNRVGASESGLTIGELEDDANRSQGWDWSQVKSTAQRLVWSGRLVITSRHSGKRIFSLPEKTLPQELLQDAPTHDEQLLYLARTAANSLGILTPTDLARHYNLTKPEAQKALELAELPVTQVEGWKEPAYLSLQAEALLSTTVEPRLIGPFDNLMRDRRRLQRIFGLEYKFEAYVPAAKRTYGPYTLGLFTGEGCLGLVDLRRRGTSFDAPRYCPLPGIDPADFAGQADEARAHLTARF